MAKTTQIGSDNRDPQTYAIIGAAMEVHKELGPGFLESVYQEALSIELTQRQIPFHREVWLDIQYKSTLLPCKFKADFICHDDVLVELKAVDRLGGADRAQLINYLKGTKKRRGLLINFGYGRLEYERFVHGPNPSVPSVSSVENLD